MKVCDNLEALLRNDEAAFLNRDYYCKDCEHAEFFLARQIRPIEDKPEIYIHSVEFYVTCDHHVKNFIVAQSNYRSDDCVSMDETGEITTVIRWCGRKIKQQKKEGKDGNIKTK